ncbi:MAG: hypothetical protein FWH48_00940 [Oscillospiraceae bacterium]|nr:hypothetical protein [Oscillospiraceae bacterium]
MVEKISLKDIAGSQREQKFIEAAMKFVCQDKDVEKFLREKALDFDKRNKSRTYLLVDSEQDEEIVILGYYTITIKNLPFTYAVSKTMVKKIDGYSNNVNSAESILIGQLGKDYNHKESISGSLVLDHAVNTVYAVHNLAGCRIVFLECSDNEKIVKFYKDNGFVFLQKSGEYLQMIRYL